MASATLSGSKRISGKGGCSLLLSWDVGMWMMVLKYHRRSLLIRVPWLRGLGACWLSKQYQETSMSLVVCSATPFGFTCAVH